MPRAVAPLVLALALLAGPARAGRIVVTIDGLHSSKGDVFVALFSRPEQFPDGDYSDQHQKVKASLEPITVTFEAPALIERLIMVSAPKKNIGENPRFAPDSACIHVDNAVGSTRLSVSCSST
jgi:hypothetical protein